MFRKLLDRFLGSTSLMQRPRDPGKPSLGTFAGHEIPPGEGWRVSPHLNDYGQHVVFHDSRAMAAFNTFEAAQAWVDENKLRAELATEGLSLGQHVKGPDAVVRGTEPLSLAPGRREGSITARVSDKGMLDIDGQGSVPVEIVERGLFRIAGGEVLSAGEIARRGINPDGTVKPAPRYVVGQGAGEWFVYENRPGMVPKRLPHRYAFKSNATRAARRLNATPPKA